MPSDEPIISCKNVWKIFGADPKKYLKSLPASPSFESIRQDGYIAAVRDVSLDIYPNEILVIMGLSGSGKSTFVRCMSRLIDITGGEVIVEGLDVMSLNEKELIDLRRRKMGMVFQNFGLLPHRTVLNNVAFPLEMRGQNVHDRRARALEVIKLVGLEGREEYFPRELSGGQQQRVGIARSLAIEPDIWFLDEPFSALDPLIRKEMQDEFLRLQGMLGKTIVFITHDFDEAIKLADRIAIMKDGAIEQCDTPDQLVLNPATDYVKKFTTEISRAKVIHVGAIAKPAKTKSAGEALQESSTLASVAKTLYEDKRTQIPVANDNGKIIGEIDRNDALNLILSDA